MGCEMKCIPLILVYLLVSTGTPLSLVSFNNDADAHHTENANYGLHPWFGWTSSTSIMVSRLLLLSLVSMSTGFVVDTGRDPIMLRTIRRPMMRVYSSSTAVKAHEVFMPALSSTMKEGKIVRWHKKVGDAVKVGDVVMVVESDKADMDVESFNEGYLAKILVQEGGVADVGTCVGLITDTKEEMSSVGSMESASPRAVVEEPKVTAMRQVNVKTTEVYMPMLSSTMTSGKVSRWVKKIGDKISKGDSLMVVESDKADMDVESFEEGYLGAILVKEGEAADVGASVALIVESPNDVDTVQSSLSTLSNSLAPSVKSPVSLECPTPRMESPPVVSGAKAESYTEEREHPFFVPHSLDQDIHEQIPPGLSVQGLADTFLRRVSNSVEGKRSLELLKSSPGGEDALKAVLERVKSRIPSHSLVFGSPRKGSIVQTSGRARSLASQRGIDLESVGGGRVTGDDVLSYETVGNAREYISGTPQATPKARQMAKDKGVDISTLKGTGPYGRVTHEDVERALGVTPSSSAISSPFSQSAFSSAISTPSSQSTPSQSTPSQSFASVVPMDGLQKAISNNMIASMGVPVFAVSRKVSTDALDALYASIKSKGVTMSAILAKAVGVTLTKHPLLNSAFDPKNGGSIRHPGSINVAMAVGTPGGLVTPVLRDADSKDLYSLSREWKTLVNKVQEKKISPKDFADATFYITNLGMFGVSHFTPILPPNTGAIMAVGASTPQVGVLSNGLLGVKRYMTLTLTADHRHIYGTHAAEFLKDLANLIENEPDRILKE